MGANKTITIDLNPYLKKELIKESLQYIFNHRGEIKTLFGKELLNEKRWQTLLSFSKHRNFSIKSYLDLCQIEYIAPGDAAETGLPLNSVDFHISNLVFEYIPLNVLEKILAEDNRIISKNGLFVHDIDYSAHFSHSDATISAINFLSYSDDEWNKYADNRYMYMNRLRYDDFFRAF